MIDRLLLFRDSVGFFLYVCDSAQIRARRRFFFNDSNISTVFLEVIDRKKCEKISPHAIDKEELVCGSQITPKKFIFFDKDYTPIEYAPTDKDTTEIYHYDDDTPCGSGTTVGVWLHQFGFGGSGPFSLIHFIKGKRLFDTIRTGVNAGVIDTIYEL